MSVAEKTGRGGKRNGAGRPRRVFKLSLDSDLVMRLEADRRHYAPDQDINGYLADRLPQLLEAMAVLDAQAAACEKYAAQLDSSIANELDAIRRDVVGQAARVERARADAYRHALSLIRPAAPPPPPLASAPSAAMVAWREAIDREIAAIDAVYATDESRTDPALIAAMDKAAADTAAAAEFI